MSFDAPYASLSDLVAGHARWNPTGTALVFGEERVTWRGLDAAVNRAANALLGCGLRRGERVSLLMATGVEYVVVLLGTIRAGGVAVPLSPLLTAESLALLIRDSDSKLLVASGALQGLAQTLRAEIREIPDWGWLAVGFEANGWRPWGEWYENASDRNPGVKLSLDDDFNIIYTSGTTGVPKGIVHTHYARMQFAQSLAIEFSFDSSAVTILTTPLFANGTWMMLLPALSVGGTVVIMKGFDPAQFLELVARERGTHTFMVPTQYMAILETPGFLTADLSSLRRLVSAGAPLRSQTKGALLARFPGRLMELYGLTEGIGTVLRPEHMEGKTASVGRPLFGFDIRIVDEGGREQARGEAGEIVGYGPALMRGYHKQKDKTEEAVWRDEAGRSYLRTGDIGRLDAEGFLYILDRKKDMILSGGMNVFPSDIEEVLSRHPQVAHVAMIGTPHEKWGETPLALVVRRADASVSADALTEWANERLAKHQRIAGVEFRADLPRNALGKILKKELREPYWSR